MLALKTGDMCPNAAFDQKACEKTCRECPFKRQNYEFLTAYGPTRMYVGKDIHYCGLDVTSLKIPRNVNIEFVGKGTTRRAVIPTEKLHYFRRQEESIPEAEIASEITETIITTKHSKSCSISSKQASNYARVN